MMMKDKSDLNMFPRATETVKIDEILAQLNLSDKYLVTFKQAGILSIDDFMAFEPEQLE